MSEIIQTKRCSKCKQIKPISEFYKDRNRHDGFFPQCKSCQRPYQKSYQPLYRKSDKGKTMIKNYRQSVSGKSAINRYRQSKKGKDANQKRFQKYGKTEKGKINRKARSIVNDTIKTGKLPRPDSLPCHYCPKPATEYHHWLGYARQHWLDVVPVCKKCHHYTNLPPAS